MEGDAVKEILNRAGDRFVNHKPGTRPEQATLARDGKWDELKTLKDILDGGVRK